MEGIIESHYNQYEMENMLMERYFKNGETVKSIVEDSKYGINALQNVINQMCEDKGLKRHSKPFGSKKCNCYIITTNQLRNGYRFSYNNKDTTTLFSRAYFDDFKKELDKRGIHVDEWRLKELKDYEDKYALYKSKHDKKIRR